MLSRAPNRPGRVGGLIWILRWSNLASAHLQGGILAMIFDRSKEELQAAEDSVAVLP